MATSEAQRVQWPRNSDDVASTVRAGGREDSNLHVFRMGRAASKGQFLLCSGTPGERYALPHSRILMHQPSGQMQGQASDIAIQAEQIIYLKRMMAERIALHTGQTVERIETDSDRDRWYTAEEAKEYGIVDRVIERAAQAEALVP